MKAALCILLVAAVAVYGAEEKKNEKRGVLGLGYGLGAPAPLYGHGLGAPAPLYGHGLYGHGLGLYNHGIGGYYGHGVAAAPLVSHGYYGGGGLYGHGLASAPLLSHSVAYGGLHAPLLGLGHGWH